MKKLFLDDERDPRDVIKQNLSKDAIYLEEGWTIVRSIMEFRRYLMKEGTPDVVSFDYWLGSQMTGLDCAQALIDHCKTQSAELPRYLVHSSDPDWRVRIYRLLNEHYYAQEV